MATSSLLGKYVRILEKQPVPSLPFSQALGEQDDEDDYRPLTVAGQQGRCVSYEGGDEHVYLVLTFDGVLAKVPKSGLEEFEPKPGEDGGFDAFWPVSEVDAEGFAVSVAESLQKKGYCVVQTFLEDSDCSEALSAAGAVKELQEYRLEVEPDYLGKRNCTKAKRLRQDRPDLEPEDALERCNHQLTTLGVLLVPLVSEYLGFNPSAQSKALARMRFSSKAEADRLSPAPLSDEDVEDGLVKSHILFLQTRRVCMLYMVTNDGGDLSLYPQDGGELKVPITKNKLILFRHDRMSYAYRPQGESLAVQAWMLGDPPSFQLSRVEGGTQEKQQLMGIVGPPAPEGIRPSIMSMMTRYPGISSDPLKYWTMQMYGTDAVTQWPIIRFDMELYYSPDPADVIYGKAYTNHGGFCDYHEVTDLDAQFFNISEREASTLSMNQRMFLEIGYETLWRSGFRKDNLWGKKIGTYVGDVGSDWHDNTKNFSMWCWDPDYTATSVNSAVVPARLSYIFGFVGPTMTFDTACSASLYATHHAHMAMLNFDEWTMESNGALVGGVNTVGQTGHVGNCQGNILTHTGRCFTFDEAADGYQRGEGCGACYMKLTNSAKDKDERLSAIVGTVSSHDGKSASLTAPSGPAQQVMLKHSLKFCGVDTTEIAFTECHGTGTALGDPIEMGAIAAVLVEDRDEPLWHTTPKSNISHLESAAGLSGLIKMVLALYHCCAPPNVHFKKLNPHVDMEGYPRMFQTEVGDLMINGGYAGCSSFGFGGSNARADVFCNAKAGPMAKTEMLPEKLDFMSVICPRCMGSMCHSCGVAIHASMARGQHHCQLLRDEFANYEMCSECYKGEFRYGTIAEDLDAWNAEMRVFISGTYSGWSTMDEMEPDGEGGFTCKVVLGDTGWEDFSLSTNHSQRLFPGTKRASASSRVMVGIEDDVKDRSWRIAGHADGKSTGSVYQISLTWGDRRTISWEPVDPESLAEDAEVLGNGFGHGYFILGSWVQWGAKQMVCTSLEKGLYESTFRIGKLGKEEFYFKRDRQDSQTIHPAQPKAERGSVPVRGPDEHVNGKHFVVRGKHHEDVTVQLCVIDGRIKVSAQLMESDITTTWESESPDAPRRYAVTGTFNHFEMFPMDEDSKGVYRCRVALTNFGTEDFQIVMDEDKSLALHPDQNYAAAGDALTLGPDADGGELFWSIGDAEPGASVDIVLDTNQQDSRKMVTWNFVNMYQLTK